MTGTFPTVFFDRPQEHAVKAMRGRVCACSHLFCDGDLEELHRAAAVLGLKRSWFQAPPRHVPHYDLIGMAKIEAARALGIPELLPREPRWRENLTRWMEQNRLQRQG